MNLEDEVGSDKRESIHDWLPGVIVMSVLIVCVTVIIIYALSMAD